LTRSNESGPIAAVTREWRIRPPEYHDNHRCLRYIRSVRFHRPAVKNENIKIGFEDIRWLRRASGKSGSGSIPPAVVKRLVQAGLLQAGPRASTMKLTDKGRIALSKLG
jgi:hypothetical protein